MGKNPDQYEIPFTASNDDVYDERPERVPPAKRSSDTAKVERRRSAEQWQADIVVMLTDQAAQIADLKADLKKETQDIRDLVMSLINESHRYQEVFSPCGLRQLLDQHEADVRHNIEVEWLQREKGLRNTSCF